jgi:hypothetical protein
MTYQEFLNILLGLVSFFGGWLFKEMWGKLKELQVVDTSLVEKLNKVEIIIASDYVRKKELEKAMDTIIAKLDKLEELEVLLADQYAKKDVVNELGRAIFAKLDRIEEKLDKKADKGGG